MRQGLPLLLALAGCAPVVHQDLRVAVRPKAADRDQAVAIFHSSQICSFTIRDASGQLQDLQERGGSTVPVAMSRAVPDRPWWLENSATGATLVTVLAMPPGRYELVGYTQAMGWEEGTDKMGRRPDERTARAAGAWTTTTHGCRSRSARARWRC